MERNRESRRGTAVISGGFPPSRRRSRAGAYRESHGISEIEDGGNDMVGRDRSNSKDRPSRRRRLSSSNESFRVDRDDVADGSSDDSMDEDHDEEDEIVRRSGGSSRQGSRGKSQLKGSDEVIGVSVPRKARSASAKRLQDSFSSVRQSSSPPARTSAASASPPSSNASIKAGKKIKPVTMKTRPLKTSNVSISESEVEVAQFLYGLTRLQSHPSGAKPEIFQASSPKLDLKYNSSNEGSASVPSKASSPVSTPVSPPSSQPMVLPHHSSPIPSPTLTAPKRKKPRSVQLEDGSNLIALIACSSKPSESTNAVSSIGPIGASPGMKVEVEKDSQDTKPEILSPTSDDNDIVRNSGSSKPENCLPVSSTSQTSEQRDLHWEEKPSFLCPSEVKPLKSSEMKLPSSSASPAAEEKLVNTDCKESADQNCQTAQREAGSLNHDFPSPDVKLETPKTISPVSDAVGVKGARFEIDLMAPPENFYPDDFTPDATDGHGPFVSDNDQSQAIDDVAVKSKGVTYGAEKTQAEEEKGKQDAHVMELGLKIQAKDAAEEVTLGKLAVNERKTESHHEENNLDKAGNKQQHFQKLPKNATRQIGRTATPVGVITSTSTPTPVMIPGWPGGLPPFGYLGANPTNPSGVPSIRGAIPMEGNAAIPNLPVVMSPYPRPKRCATHLFIARFTRYLQQLARLNPFWHAAAAAAAAGSAAPYGAKPYNMNILPQSDVLLFSGGSAIRSPNLLSNNGLGSGSGGSLTGQNPKEKLPNSVADAQRKQPLLPQPAQQSRVGESKPGTIAENVCLLSTSGAAATPANGKFGNMAAATSDPQYLAMLHSNYPFSIPPPYRAHVNQQQQQPTAAPFFGGSFYPSQIFQLQSHAFPQSQTPTAATGSLTSQKHLLPQHGFPTPNPSLESHGAELQPAKKGEDGNDSQALVVQKKHQGQNFPSNSSFNPNFLQNFPIVGLGGKQLHQPGDPGLQMSLKGVEVAGSAPPGHAMLQALPDVGQSHYQLGNHSKGPVKAPAPRASDKSLESSHPQSMAAAVQQQAMARAKPAVSAASTAAAASGVMAYPDQMPVAYSSANFPAGPVGFPNMQSSLQWKMQSSQRVAQAGPLGNAVVQSPTAALGTPNAGSPAVKAMKLPSTHLNSSQKVAITGQSVLTQPVQGQSLGKSQQLFFSSPESVQQVGSGALSQKHHAEPNSMVQAVFPGSVNMRRPPNQPAQPVLTVAGASSYLAGGGKGAAIYGPMVGGPISTVAGASFGKSAANLPTKSTEQKPAAA